MSSPVQVAQLNLKNLRYSNVTVNEKAKGAKCIYVNYAKDGKNSEPLLIQFPLMTTWGAGLAQKSDENDRDKYKMSLQFPREDERTEEMNTFLQKMQDLEEQIITDAVANSEKWWGKKRGREGVSETFGHAETGAVLKFSKNKETQQIDRNKPPTMSLKLSQYNDKFQFGLFTLENGHPKMLYSPTDASTSSVNPLEYLPKLCKAQCVVSLSLWILGNTFYPVFTLKQAICQNPTNTTFNYNSLLIGGLSSSDKEELSKPVSVSAETTSHSSGLQIEDSDEDDDVPTMGYIKPKVEADESDDEVIAPTPKNTVPVAPVPLRKQPEPEPESDEEEPVAVAVVQKKKKTKTSKA